MSGKIIFYVFIFILALNNVNCQTEFAGLDNKKSVYSLEKYSHIIILDLRKDYKFAGDRIREKANPSNPNYEKYVACFYLIEGKLDEARHSTEEKVFKILKDFKTSKNVQNVDLLKSAMKGLQQNYQSFGNESMNFLNKCLELNSADDLLMEFQNLEIKISKPIDNNKTNDDNDGVDDDSKNFNQQEIEHKKISSELNNLIANNLTSILDIIKKYTTKTNDSYSEAISKLTERRIKRESFDDHAFDDLDCERIEMDLIDYYLHVLSEIDKYRLSIIEIFNKYTDELNSKLSVDERKYPKDEQYAVLKRNVDQFLKDYQSVTGVKEIHGHFSDYCTALIEGINDVREIKKKKLTLDLVDDQSS